MDKEIYANIRDGEYDEELSLIISACRRRLELIGGVAPLPATPKVFDFQLNQLVEFNVKTRPSYLIGQKAKIIKINNKRIIVQLVNGQVGRFRGDISTTPGLLCLPANKA